MAEHKAKKTLGQNFLKDNQAAQLMVRSLDMQGADNIIEIGGGTGVLTRLIVEKKNNYKKLTVYEIDKDLKPGLAKILNQTGENEPAHTHDLIFENVLDADFSSIGKYKIIGSLPYYVTSPIIHRMLQQKNRSDVCVFLVQKEVGEKLTSKPPKATYWTYITLGYDVKKIAIVKAEAFSPIPKVDSMIIKFTKNLKTEETLFKIGIFKWEKFLHHVYKNPRKMINKTFDKALLIDLNIDSNLRPQNLELTDLLKIYYKQTQAIAI